MTLHFEKFDGYSFNDNGEVYKNGIKLSPEPFNYSPNNEIFHMKFIVCAESLIWTKEQGWQVQERSYRYHIFEGIKFYYFDIINGVVHYYFVTCTEE